MAATAQWAHQAQPMLTVVVVAEAETIASLAASAGHQAAVVGVARTGAVTAATAKS